ncbi:MAG: alpha/beta fold hydrolase [Candidatus Helarchaeota archaeon]|nr:alpha/beta fold hydrolase [Candidatus Helarchaeota archaeon]
MKASTYSVKIFLILFVILTIIYSTNLLRVKNSPNIYSLDQAPELNLHVANDITDIWNISEIQNIDLNITIEDTQYHWDATYQKNLTVTRLYYTSQYWINNTPMRIYGALVFPENYSDYVGQLPGIVVMHGIGGNHYQTLPLAYFLAANNYTAIAIDFPGHGNSSGPPPTSEWIVPDLSDFNGNITPDLLNRTHFYLISRAAVRAVDVLLNQSEVDPTRIAMTGGSYGGLTTMFASNVYWEKVRSAIPVIASGNLDISFSTPYSLTRLIVGQNVDLSEPPLSDLFQYFDPINYVNTSNNPATLYICGSNDDFFPIETFNNTFYATRNTTKAMAMTPGGHHGLLMDPMEGTMLFWLNHTLFDGPAPPRIQVTKGVESTVFGSKLKVTANVTCDVPISKVILATHREILGATWKEHEMEQLDPTTWTFELRSLPFNAEVTYFVIVELENGELYTAFSSYVWRDTLTTWLEIPFFILIGVGLALPIFLLVRRDYRKMQLELEAPNRRKYLYLTGAQLGGIGGTEIVIATSIFLPLLVILPQSGHLEISLATFLTEFIDMFPIMAPLVFIILIAGFIFAISKPILGGLINLILPATLLIIGLLVFGFVGGYSDNQLVAAFSENLIDIGSGLILLFTMSGVQIGFGIFKRKYQKRLRTPKS